MALYTNIASPDGECCAARGHGRIFGTHSSDSPTGANSKTLQKRGEEFQAAVPRWTDGTGWQCGLNALADSFNCAEPNCNDNNRAGFMRPSSILLYRDQRLSQSRQPKQQQNKEVTGVSTHILSPHITEAPVRSSAAWLHRSQGVKSHCEFDDCNEMGGWAGFTLLHFLRMHYHRRSPNIPPKLRSHIRSLREVLVNVTSITNRTSPAGYTREQPSQTVAVRSHQPKNGQLILLALNSPALVQRGSQLSRLQGQRGDEQEDGTDEEMISTDDSSQLLPRQPRSRAPRYLPQYRPRRQLPALQTNPITTHVVTTYV